MSDVRRVRFLSGLARRSVCAAAVVGGVLMGGAAQAITIVVDYQYDDNGFFSSETADGMAARAALEAAADRYSSVITSSLGAVSLTDDSRDDRIGFTHPATGALFNVSPATSAATDALVGAGASAADEYRGPWSIAADEWILYAGGRSLTSAGVGGTATGTNFTTVYADGASVENRGFRATGSSSNLPVWGGSISFDNDGSTVWNFDHTIAAPSGMTDFYSIALHEIGHALGLSSTWLDWTEYSSGGVFSGPEAVDAYNADNGATETGLNEVSTTNHHWEDGTYDSFIFSQGGPNLVGTVGLGVLQDLLMEPTANFVFPTVRRFELTNVDVGALRDVGWETLPEPASLALLVGGGLVMVGRRSPGRDQD